MIQVYNKLKRHLIIMNTITQKKTLFLSLNEEREINEVNDGIYPKIQNISVAMISLFSIDSNDRI